MFLLFLSIEVLGILFSITVKESRSIGSANLYQKESLRGIGFMKFSNKLSHIGTGALLVLFALTTLGSTGCTVYNNGMTLPSPHYHKNHPQYFPRGAEFPFPNEAANLQDTNRDYQRAP